MRVGGIQEARRLLAEAKLGFPPIPGGLERELKERGTWCFSTKPLEASPYDFAWWQERLRDPTEPNQLVLAHDGHGINSYAISYYLVHNDMRLLLQLAWGGVYMDPAQSTAQVRDAFSVLKEAWPRLEQRFADGARSDLRMFAHSDFYGGLEVRGGTVERFQPRPLDLRSALAQLRLDD